ncbi:MAG: glycosyltransferase family 4 protein, partial [Anaerolineales bacterium]
SHNRMTMDQRTLSIVHPWDPWTQGVGGFDTALDGILRYAPREWSLEVIGLTSDPDLRPSRRWIDTVFADRPVRFFAALHDPEPDRVRRLPLSLRFTVACRAARVNASGRIVQFHRFETAYGLPRWPGQRWVYFLHNHPTEAQSPMSDVRWRRLARLHIRMITDRLRRADAVAAVDPRTPGWIQSHLPSLSGRVLLLPQWADPAVFSPGGPEERERARVDLRRSLAASPDARIVLFAGRLETQKDPLGLVDAIENVARVRDDVLLVIVGKGRLEGSITERARSLGIGDRLRLMGPVERSRLASLYRGADVVACTSAYEAGPRYVFEALACGTPAVSFDVGQVTPVLEKEKAAGRLVARRTTQAFSQALLEVLAQARDAASVRRCAASVEGFRPESSLRALFDVYRGWLSSPPSA